MTQLTSPFYCTLSAILFLVVDATETESPINTSSALVENDLLREVDATETESPTNTSSALVENDLLPEVDAT